ncbi:hypothetical protein D3C72_2570440 [compost metagenome]
MAVGLQMPSRRANNSFFTAMFSNTASITRSAWARSCKSSELLSKAMRCSMAWGVMRPFLAVFS